jgi:hypothetical protein
MAQSGDESVLETGKELGISLSSRRRWINEYDESFLERLLDGLWI